MTWQSLVYESVGMTSQMFSLRYIHILGQALGHAMWYLLPKRRQLAIEAMKHHLELTTRQARQMAHSNFLHIGCSFSELLFNRRMDLRFMQSHFSIEHPEIMSSIVSAKRPIVAVTAHLGAWELLAGTLWLNFSDRASQIIVQKTKNKALNQFIVHCRQHAGVHIVYNKQSSRNILRCLKKNGISAFLVDHNCGRRKAFFLPFFNKYAAVNMGPAFLAVKSQALIWPIFLLRKAGQKYCLHPHPPLDTRDLPGNHQEQMVQAASFYTKTVEDMVLNYPEQWFWMHKRWKTQPKSEAELQHALLAKNLEMN
jgi:KDO2-lipid IV(A) lauroyltransferase